MIDGKEWENFNTVHKNTREAFNEVLQIADIDIIKEKHRIYVKLKRYLSDIILTSMITCNGNERFLCNLYNTKRRNTQLSIRIINWNIRELNFPVHGNPLPLENHCYTAHITNNPERGIKLYNIKKTHFIPCRDFNVSSRCLLLSLNTLLVTGGYIKPQNSCLINIETGDIEELGHLNNKRTSHAMSWIDGKPAVIGGKQSESAMKSVEVLENSMWTKKTPLYMPRSDHTASFTGAFTFVFGGLLTTQLDSIERYYEGEWEILLVNLPFPCSGIGCISIDPDTILLVGGCVSANVFSSDVFRFDAKTLEIHQENTPLKRKAFFPYNTWYLHDNSIIGFTWQGIPIRYTIQSHNKLII